MFAKLNTFIGLLLISTFVVASPDIQSWEERGAKVLFVQAPELPMVDISVVFNAGAARDGNMSGLAKLTNAMLDEGAADMNADQIADSFAAVGAKYSGSSERDMAVLGLRSLTEPSVLNKALATFATVVSKPTFPESSFSRLKQQLLRGLEAEKQSPDAMAAREFYQQLYGQHAYAKMPSGQSDSVQAIQVKDLQNFYQKYYVSNNATVAIVGDMTQQQAATIARQILAGLNSGEAAPAIKQVPALTKSNQVTLEHPSTQTTILMGQIGMSRHDPDYFPLYVGNHILGGSGLVSMLSDEVREKRGLTYGVYSYFRPMMMQGPYVFSLKTRNDQKQEALNVMRDTLIGFVKNGPTAEQVEAAKRNITGGFALRVDSNSEIASYLAMIGFYDLPLDYLDTFNDKVNQVTAEQIKQAFERRVYPDKMLTVMVGGEE